MPATSHPRHFTVTEPPRSIPAHLSGADEVSYTVTSLHDDIVLVRLDSGQLSIEVPLPSDAALDLSFNAARLPSSRLRRSDTTD